MLRSIIIISLLVSCSARQDGELKSPAVPEQESAPSSSATGPETLREEMAPDILTSLAAKAVTFDSLHKFVKTANVEFRTKDVVRTVLEIEKIAGELNGFVASSDLRTDEKETRIVPVDENFNREFKRFTTVSSITLRVPSDQLNSFLLKLQPFVEYLGHRNVTATNIAFDQYLKKMIQFRISSHSLRVLSGKPKASDLDQLLDRELQSDREHIEDMKLDEQVKFSTVHLQISGPDQLSVIKVPTISIEEYQPSFGTRFVNAVSVGWNMVLGLFVFLISTWPVLLLAVGVTLIIRKKYARIKS